MVCTLTEQKYTESSLMYNNWRTRVCWHPCSGEMLRISKAIIKECGAGPVVWWLRLLTRMQEVRGSNPGAAPPKIGVQTLPYPASRSQRSVKGLPLKGTMWDGVVRWKLSTQNDKKIKECSSSSKSSLRDTSHNGPVVFTIYLSDS